MLVKTIKKHCGDEQNMLCGGPQGTGLTQSWGAVCQIPFHIPKVRSNVMGRYLAKLPLFGPTLAYSVRGSCVPDVRIKAVTCWTPVLQGKTWPSSRLQYFRQRHVHDITKCFFALVQQISRLFLKRSRWLHSAKTCMEEFGLLGCMAQRHKRI